MMAQILKLQPCKSLCDHKLGSNIFLPLPYYSIQAILNSLEGVYVTEDTAKRTCVNQVKVKPPCAGGILVLICACVFVSLDLFASDEVHELVKQ